MTDDSIAVRGLLEKSAADFLREMIGFAAERRKRCFQATGLV